MKRHATIVGVTHTHTRNSICYKNTYSDYLLYLKYNKKLKIDLL